MSNLCKTQLCNAVQTIVNNTTCASSVEDILFNTISVDSIQPTNRISEIITVADLPDASTVPNGHMIFSNDVKVPVISSNGSWIGLDGRVLGTRAENPLFAWGVNTAGQLGDGTATLRTSPVREFCNATDWCQVSAGSSSTTLGVCTTTAAIKTSGQLWAWGSNFCGQSGDGTVITRCRPVREFCSATDWCQVSVGWVHTAAVKTSGELWAWGRNDGGQLGDGTTVDRCSPVREFCSATDWCGVSLGYSNRHTVAIKTTGQIWAWGCNNCGGVLGDGTVLGKCSPVREISSSTDWCGVSAGSDHNSAIKTSGQIWSWGIGSSGSLGIGLVTSHCSPVREICSATDWCQVDSGSDSTAAVKTSGQIWLWGLNCIGRLGDGTTVARCSPIREFCSATDWCQVSISCHTAAVKTSGQLWTWGCNGSGELGDGTGTSRCSPVREFTSSRDWCQVKAGYRSSFAIKATIIPCR